MHKEDHAPYLERAFALQPSEHSGALVVEAGRIPEYIQGAYYLIGPAVFSNGGLQYRHWLDGDGLVCAIHFNRGRAELTSRFVANTKREMETEAGRPLFRTFGTTFPDDRLLRGMALEPVINVSIHRWGESLLAFGEQGLPWRLDRHTLETQGKFDFERQLNDLSPFSGHPRFDRSTGACFNFGVQFSNRNPNLNLYRFDKTGRLVWRKRHPLPFAASMHDFVLSPNLICCHVSPYILNIEKMMRDGATVIDALSWEPERGSSLALFNRKTGEAVANVPVGQGYCLHFINAWESGGQLAVDLLELKEPIYPQYQTIPDLFSDVSPGKPVRYLIDTRDGTLISRTELSYDAAPDFPTVDPRLSMKPYNDFWMLGISATGKPGRKFLDQLVHCRWHGADAESVYQAPPNHYLGGEPIFLPDPNSSGGAIICQMLDAKNGRGWFLLFDAMNIAAGPIAKLALTEPLPLLFHAYFHEGK